MYLYEYTEPSSNDMICITDIDLLPFIQRPSLNTLDLPEIKKYGKIYGSGHSRTNVGLYLAFSYYSKSVL